MSTHSTVSFADEAGNLTGIYVHMDGYPTGAGDDIAQLAADGRLAELKSVVEAYPAGLSSFSCEQKDLAEYAYDDIPPSESEQWRVSGNWKQGTQSRHEEWNYIITPDNTLRVSDYKNRLLTVLDLNDDIQNIRKKLDWLEEIDD